MMQESQENVDRKAETADTCTRQQNVFTTLKYLMYSVAIRQEVKS